jgi:tRNA modification GTPase
MNLTDTILATSSPPISAGQTLRSILRLSGPDAWPAACHILPIKNPAVGIHTNLPIPLLHPTAPLASLLLFRSPKSFTGDDIAELHLPASPGLLHAVTEELLLRPNTRLANPGEFSARAFFNQKIDLTQAEGIAATISATNTVQLRAATGLREGVLHKEMLRLTHDLAHTLALLEAGIDFSDESGVSFLSLESAATSLQDLALHIDQLLLTSVRVDRPDALPTVVLLGKPNVGKSSLINALTHADRAIVSPIAGTTRDLLPALLHTPAGDIRLIDAPGEESPTDDLRAKMMQARATALLEADLVIHVIAPDDHGQLPAHRSLNLPTPQLTVHNKSDLLPASAAHEFPDHFLAVSAKTGHHLSELRDTIARLAYRRELLAESRLALNHRHRSLLHEAHNTLASAALYTHDTAAFHRHPELLAAELRAALDTLGQITGTISPDEILGRIFSTFCIGK